MKKVIITAPFDEGMLPFQRPIFEIAKTMKYFCEEHVAVPRALHYFLFHWPVNFSMPFLSENVRMQFVSGTHPEPMIFPYAYRNEIVPIIWDCWPDFVQHMVKIFNRCCIKVAFFTSKQTANYFSKKYPDRKIFFLPEAINTKLYYSGNRLKERKVDVLEYGRLYKSVHEQLIKIPNIRHLFANDGEKLFSAFDDLAKCIANTKIVVCYPRSITHPEMAKGVETLTQRYWECMYSGTIIVGKAPQELIDLLGYNPVIEARVEEMQNVIKGILVNIEQYQELADKNRLCAQEYGDWRTRFEFIEKKLRQLNYTMRSR